MWFIFEDIRIICILNIKLDKLTSRSIWQCMMVPAARGVRMSGYYMHIYGE